MRINWFMRLCVCKERKEGLIAIGFASNEVDGLIGNLPIDCLSFFPPEYVELDRRFTALL